MPVLSEVRTEKKRSPTPTGCFLAGLLAVGLFVVGTSGNRGLGVWRVPIGGYLFSAGNDNRFQDAARRAEIQGLFLDNRAPEYESRTVSLGPFWWAWEWPRRPAR
jgi:hypothetical protein